MHKKFALVALVLIATMSIAGLVLPEAHASKAAPADEAAATEAGHDSGGSSHEGAEAGSHEEAGEEGHGGHTNLGTELPLWTVIPFVGILLSIALFPLVAPKFWHHHFGKISAAWAVVFAVPFLIFYKGTAFHEILHIYFIDYIPFIVLLWALFTISGGILIKGTLKGKPIVNTVILLIGTALASWIGTTGAAMLLIRPLLRANDKRKHKVHIIVFFIFLVANIGGSLTPLGDPPLFLGFLHQVPFFWTMKLLPMMAVVVSILIVVFFAMDTFFYRKEDPKALEEPGEKAPLRIEGYHNFLFLGGVMGGVLMSGTVDMGSFDLLGVHLAVQNEVKDAILILMGVLSMVTTKKAIREGNGFSWFPIQEVAILFAGIFMTIIPALAILKSGTAGSLSFVVEAVKTPAHYFWITGGLSSFLDNAPTYLTFFNTALGSLGLQESQVPAALGYMAPELFNPTFFHYLEAIAAGAVFMGANTYIGNAPNFMVKSIAEEGGVPMPSFFGYMIKYSIPILLSTFVIVTLIFFL